MGGILTSRLVAGGRKSVVHANITRIEGTVREEYAERMAAAGRLPWVWLRWRIRREVRRQLNKIASKDGLYARRWFGEPGGARRSAQSESAVISQRQAQTNHKWTNDFD